MGRPCDGVSSFCSLGSERVSRSNAQCAASWYDTREHAHTHHEHTVGGEERHALHRQQPGFVRALGDKSEPTMRSHSGNPSAGRVTCTRWEALPAARWPSSRIGLALRFKRSGVARSKVSAVRNGATVSISCDLLVKIIGATGIQLQPVSRALAVTRSTQHAISIEKNTWTPTYAGARWRPADLLIL